MTEPDVYDLAGQSGTVTDGTEQPEQEAPHYTAYEFRMAAYNGEFPDERLPMPDRILWWAWRDMYQRFKSGQITKEQGEAEKKKASQQYLRDRAMYDEYTKTTEHFASLWKSVEAAATNYAKSNGRTPEADALFEAVYNARPK